MLRPNSLAGHPWHFLPARHFPARSCLAAYFTVHFQRLTRQDSEHGHIICEPHHDCQ